MRQLLPLLFVVGVLSADVNKSNPETANAIQSGIWTVQPGNTANTTPWLVTPAPATLAVTALSAANAAVTATLPAVAAQFHYITSIHITRTCTAALTGSAALA